MTKANIDWSPGARAMFHEHELDVIAGACLADELAAIDERHAKKARHLTKIGKLAEDEDAHEQIVRDLHESTDAACAAAIDKRTNTRNGRVHRRGMSLFLKTPQGAERILGELGTWTKDDPPVWVPATSAPSWITDTTPTAEELAAQAALVDATTPPTVEGVNALHAKVDAMAAQNAVLAELVRKLTDALGGVVNPTKNDDATKANG